MPDLSLEEIAEYDLSVKEAAHLCGVGVQTIRLYIREGRLNALRMGRSYRIRRVDLEAFVNGAAGGEDGSTERSTPAVGAPDLAALLYQPEVVGDAAA